MIVPLEKVDQFINQLICVNYFSKKLNLTIVVQGRLISIDPSNNLMLKDTETYQLSHDLPTPKANSTPAKLTLVHHKYIQSIHRIDSTESQVCP